MTKIEFIEQIATYVLKYAPDYNIRCASPIIAQACLESAYGTSYKAQFHNYFGLKFRANRCPSSNGKFADQGAEQNPDGSYSAETTFWFQFPNLEAGVKGYFDFTNISNYKNLKGIEDPLQYLKNIKADGYATSLNYVDKVNNVIKQWNLTVYDTALKKKLGDTPQGFSNSSLVDYTCLSPNYNPRKYNKITKITIHHMAGNCSVETCGNIFVKPERKASSNYGIGTDGRVGLYVEEKNRSWCSSNAENDHQAVTIEVANNSGAPDWTVSDKAYNKLIDLCVDICRRNEIKRINYTGDTSGNLTMHKWFAATACPGPYLSAKFPEIANKINERLGNYVAPTPTVETPKELYRVRITWEDAKSQIGAYSILENAKKNCKPGYKVFNSKGEVVFENNPKVYGVIRYTVKRGDTLNKIAKIYGKTAQEIGRINNLEDINKIRTGQILVIDKNAEILKVKTNGAKLNIRKESNTSSDILGDIPNGNGVHLIEKNGSWFKIEYNEIVGYCYSEYLR